MGMTSTVKPPLVVTVFAKKGGPGKTTLAQLLISAARARGLTVWGVDFDPQCNLTNLLISGSEYEAALKAFARKEGRRPPSLFDVVSEENPTAGDIGMALHPAGEKWSGVSLLPASDRLDLLEHLPRSPENAGRFARALDGVHELAGIDPPDLVVCDTRPAINVLTVMALTAAHVDLAVVKPERWSVEGLRDAWRTLDTLIEAEALPNLLGAHVLLNGFDSRSSEHNTRAPEIQKVYSQVLLTPTMPLRSVIQLAISAGYPLHDYPDKRSEQVLPVLKDWLDKLIEMRSQI